jgi:hypothetical protein
MPVRLLPRLIIPATLVALLAACGGAVSPPASSGDDAGSPTTAPVAIESLAPGAADPTPGTKLTACELVTADDVQGATGTAETVAAGKGESGPTVLSPGRTVCTYEGDFGRVLVDLVPEDGANLYDAARKAYDDASDITGVGDGAFSSDHTSRTFVWKGAVTVMLTTLLLGEADMRAVSEDLADRVVAKL